MTTTLGQPSGPTLTAVDGSSARSLLAHRESAGRRVLRLIVLLLAVGVLVKGWMVTDINLGKLADAPNAAPILRALVTPDVATRDVTPVSLQTEFDVSATPIRPESGSVQSVQTLRIVPGSASAGQTVTFDGSGFAPNASGQLRIKNASLGMDVLFTRIQTDDKGRFHEQRTWPPVTVVPEGQYQFELVVNAPAGDLHPSETLINSVSRIGETILLALMGTVFGVLFSVPLSFLGARNLTGGSPVGRTIYGLVRLIFTITRSIEVLILGVIMVVIVGIGSYAGVLAIVVHSIGSLGKLYSDAIENIEPGPVEAITATGADRLSTVLYGVVPQVIPTFLAVTIYWWDHNVRMSTVLGLVGGGGIGYLLIQYMNLLQFNQAATVLWLIVIVVTAMDYASAIIRSRLV